MQCRLVSSSETTDEALLFKYIRAQLNYSEKCPVVPRIWKILLHEIDSMNRLHWFLTLWKKIGVYSKFSESNQSHVTPTPTVWIFPLKWGYVAYVTKKRQNVFIQVWGICCVFTVTHYLKWIYDALCIILSTLLLVYYHVFIFSSVTLNV